MPKHRNVQFYERIVWQHCVYALARFRNKDHLVRVRKGSSFGFTNLSFHHKHSWTYPYIDVKTANVVTATNVETQSRTVVTGLPGFSPLTPPSSFPSPDKKSGHKHGRFEDMSSPGNVHLWSYQWFTETLPAIVSSCRLDWMWLDPAYWSVNLSFVTC